ncbi:MAG: PLP-dependent transferase, partial [Planctomycetota bacterium]
PKHYPGRGARLRTFGYGDQTRALIFNDSLKLAKNLATLGDAKTLVIHPASTIFHEFSPDEQKSMGVSDDMIRVSVGIEDFEDIRADFQQAIERTFKEIK